MINMHQIIGATHKCSLEKEAIPYSTEAVLALNPEAALSLTSRAHSLLENAAKMRDLARKRGSGLGLNLLLMPLSISLATLAADPTKLIGKSTPQVQAESAKGPPSPKSLKADPT